MKLTKRVIEAFKRSSSALCLVVLTSFLILALSTAYHCVAYEREDFFRKPEMQEYENAVENVGRMSEWDRTTFYWSNNLRVANIYVLGSPAYAGLELEWWGCYTTGANLSFWYHRWGSRGLLSFSSAIFMHGILELTGIFIVAAATARLAWNLWKGLAHLMQKVKRSGTLRPWRVFELGKREIRKYGKRIKGFAADFLILVLVGELLIFFGAPIEACVSPQVLAAFYLQPWLAFLWLAVIAFFYFRVFFVDLHGFERMRRDAGALRKDLGLVLKGEWKPSLLSFGMFIACSAVLAVSIIF